MKHPGNTALKAKRIQAILPQKSAERLNSLKDKTEASSETEVIKNALRLYEWLINQSENGSEFYLKTKDGDLVHYNIFIG